MTRHDFLEAMTKEPLLDPESFELDARNPEIVQDTVGSLIQAGYEIEGDTVSTAETVRLLAPGPHVDIWEAQELWHSLLYADIALRNDIELPELHYCLPEKKIETIGRFVRHSDTCAQLFGMVVDIEGYKNERQNMAAQNRAVTLLQTHDEHSIARAFRAMYRQEAYHAGYYLEDLRLRRAQHPLLYCIAKRISSRDAMPIGANTPERIVRIGAVMVDLFDQSELTDIVRKTTRVLDLSARQAEKQEHAIIECMEAYRDSVVA